MWASKVEPDRVYSALNRIVTPTERWPKVAPLRLPLSFANLASLDDNGRARPLTWPSLGPDDRTICMVYGEHMLGSSA